MEDPDPEIQLGDEVPPTRVQAESKKWKSDIFSFGKAEQLGRDFFNPGLVRRPDGLWLLARMSEARDGMPFGHNQIVAFKLLDRQPTAGTVLKFPNSKEDEQFEDARAVYWNGQTWVSCVNFTWYMNGSWTGAHQMLGIFKDTGNGVDITPESWSPLARRDPIVGTNQGKPGPTYGKHNKNLTWFFLRDTLYCLYTSDPWKVVQFGSKWEDQTPYVHEGVTWSYGIVRGGTPPVLVDDKYFTFFHSSMPWRGRYRRYYMGAIAFEGNPPFKPLLWTHEPILIGSQNDPWKQRKPLVVFPCGAVMEDGKWFITMGINDLKCGWVEIPHADVLKMLTPAPQKPGLALLSEHTPIPEHAPIPYQEDEEEDLSGSTEGRTTTRVEQVVSSEDAHGANQYEKSTPDSVTTQTSENQASPAQTALEPHPSWKSTTCPPLKRKRGRPRKIK